MPFSISSKREQQPIIRMLVGFEVLKKLVSIIVMLTSLKVNERGY
ncbi:MAG: hypothetical protein QW707_03835 [Candidatus Bathyarchaeia archaeon]